MISEKFVLFLSNAYNFNCFRIYYVSRSKIKSLDSEKIKGDYSSKITCIVNLILKLKKQQEMEDEAKKTESSLEVESKGVKILIFSQWEPIITAIAAALKENDISHRSQCTPKTIEEFKVLLHQK